MTSEAASPVTRVSGQVDHWALTKCLNPSNERYRIQSNKIRAPMTAKQEPTSEKLQQQDHVTPQCVHSRLKSNEIKREYKSQICKIFYDRGHLRLRSSRQRKRRERTYGGEPALSKLTSGREKEEEEDEEREELVHGRSSFPVENHFTIEVHLRWKHTRCGRPTTITTTTKIISIMNDQIWSPVRRIPPTEANELDAQFWWPIPTYSDDWVGWHRIPYRQRPSCSSIPRYNSQSSFVRPDSKTPNFIYPDRWARDRQLTMISLDLRQESTLV